MKPAISSGTTQLRMMMPPTSAWTTRLHRRSNRANTNPKTIWPK